MEFCRTYRDLRRYVKRGFIRKGLFAVLLFQSVIAILCSITLIQQSALKTAQEKIEVNQQRIDKIQIEISEAARVNRTMLNARGYIQLQILCTGKRRNAFLLSEFIEIKNRYHDSEYDQVIKPAVRLFETMILPAR